ncbi:PREDICTED: galectin-3-binding protein [Chinchilla lanigera]|uniref:Galectin-3-binding protein n=1 Tax=Chinchilla lanigera TaxID=34839 RepID=A0A8C2YQN1_CHILA|nr:PREDICTED: galectin-3-binding protein [Chinchilla lanigera]
MPSVAALGRVGPASKAMAVPWLLWLWLLVPGTQGAQDGDMRLVNGATANEGRVEIFYGDQWGTVCDNLWNLADANVVCRALGFENATEALGGAAFGPGTGPVMLDEVQCTGTEPSLASCRSLGWKKSYCGHEKDAGVVCTNDTRGEYTLDLSGELSAALGLIFDSQQGCDLSIQVVGQEQEELAFCAHSVILTANPEAQALWEEPGSKIIMRVDSECMSVVRDFLRYFYSRRIEVSLASVKCLHKLASAYRAVQLQDYCGRLFSTLLPQDPSFRTPLDLYTYAQDTSDALLEERCVQFLAWNFGALTQAEAWLSVPTALLQALLLRDEVAVPSELALLQALDAWIRKQGTSQREAEVLLEQIRFPMMLPKELFQLQFNLSLYQDHEALFRKKILQALEFHTVPLWLLAQYQGLNFTDDIYKPRIYTSATWSALVTANSWTQQLSSRNQRRKYSTYPYYYVNKSSYGYMSSPSQSFQTPEHPSFLFKTRLVSWTLAYLPNMQSCWNYGFSCSSDELPALGLTKSSSSDSTIGYENRALMLCRGGIVVDVLGFQGSKTSIPSALGTNSTRAPSTFPCAAGSFSSFRVAIRPFYLTNATSLD